MESFKEIRIGESNEGTIMIFSPYNVDFIAEIRKIEGRRWNSDSKCWMVPREKMEEARKAMNTAYGYDDVSQPELYEKEVRIEGISKYDLPDEDHVIVENGKILKCIRVKYGYDYDDFRAAWYTYIDISDTEEGIKYREKRRKKKLKKELESDINNIINDSNIKTVLDPETPEVDNEKIILDYRDEFGYGKLYYYNDEHICEYTKFLPMGDFCYYSIVKKAPVSEFFVLLEKNPQFKEVIGIATCAN